MPSSRLDNEGDAPLIEATARLALPAGAGEAVFYRRTPPRPAPPGLIGARDIAEALVQAMMAAFAAVAPVRSWPGFCRRLARLGRPSDEAGRLAAFAGAFGAVLGERPESEARAVFERWWEGLYRRRMMVVREYVRAGPVRFSWTGREHLEAAQAAGGGAVIWAGDFVFQTLAGKRALHEGGFPVHQVSSSQHGFRHTRFGNACLNRLQVRAENRYLAGRLAFDGQETGMLIRKAMRILAAGGFVAFTNNVFAGRSFVQLPLGTSGSVSMATTPIQLALREGVPLFCVTVIEREPLRHYEIRVSEDLAATEGRAGRTRPARSGSEAVACIAARARDELLACLREAPDQFLNWLPLGRPAVADPGPASEGRADL